MTIDTKALRELCERARVHQIVWEQYGHLGYCDEFRGYEAALRNAATALLDAYDEREVLRERLRAAEELVALVRSRVSISQFGPVWGKAFMATEAHAALIAFDAEGKK